MRALLLALSLVAACAPEPRPPALSAPTRWEAPGFVGMRAVPGWRPLSAGSLKALNPHASFGALHDDGPCS